MGNSDHILFRKYWGIKGEMYHLDNKLGRKSFFNVCDIYAVFGPRALRLLNANKGKNSPLYFQQKNIHTWDTVARLQNNYFSRNVAVKTFSVSNSFDRNNKKIPVLSPDRKS